jgi:hypothetical protein
MPGHIITLITDFGLIDGYVASMKGVILGIAPDAKIVDITHYIEPQSILQASIVLATCTDYFPENTIHVAVVDPGVGTDRALLAVRARKQIFLAPDNGLLGFMLDKCTECEIRNIENRELYLPRVSATFHGRDILAPVAAHLAAGVPFEDVGRIADQYQKNTFPYPVIKGGVLRGQIVYRDHFGNLMTNITAEDLKMFDLEKIEVRTGYSHIKGLSKAYSDVEKGELLCLFGSAGYLEIALREGSAADKLRFPIGTLVEVIQGEN